ncbi:unnamed protein product [Sphacelaria rigidula]
MAEPGRSGGGAANWLVDLIMKPGTAVRLVPAINVTLALILLILTGLAVSGDASIHVFVMGFLAVGLMASVNWFMSEFNKIKLQQQQQDQGAAPTTTVTGAERTKSD